MSSFQKYALRYPPILCRLLARVPNSRPLSIDEIASRGGMSNLEVVMLSERTSWDEVPFMHMMRFLKGCGVDFGDARQMRRVNDYIAKRPTWKYLKSSGRWTDTYEPMLKQYAQTLVQKSR